MTHGGDGPARVEFEREPHPLARRDESPDGAPLLRHEGSMQARSVRLDEGVGDDLRRIRDSREGVLPEGEAESEPRRTLRRTRENSYPSKRRFDRCLRRKFAMGHWSG